MFMAFAAGARLVIVPGQVKMAPSKLCQILFDEERVTILQVTLWHFKLSSFDILDSISLRILFVLALYLLSI